MELEECIMLNNLFKIGLLLVIAIGFTTINLEHADAASKVMWGKTELKLGQIGKVTVLAQTNLVKLESNGSLTTVRTLKKGDEFRVYSYKSNQSGLYGVGGGNFIQKGTKVKYETPSKSKMALLKEVRGGLAPKVGLKLTYFPTFTDKTQKDYVVEKESSGDQSYISLNYKGSITGGYSYQESSDGISMGANETDWIFFDLAYPMIEGKQTKYYYYTEDWEQAYDYVNVESTTSTVTVKAGTFKNVVIIRYSGGGTYYFAPGYGVIKVVDSNGKITTELISVQ